MKRMSTGHLTKMNARSAQPSMNTPIANNSKIEQGEIGDFGISETVCSFVSATGVLENDVRHVGHVPSARDPSRRRKHGSACTEPTLPVHKHVIRMSGGEPSIHMTHDSPSFGATFIGGAARDGSRVPIYIRSRAPECGGVFFTNSSSSSSSSSDVRFFFLASFLLVFFALLLHRHTRHMQRTQQQHAIMMEIAAPTVNIIFIAIVSLTPASTASLVAAFEIAVRKGRSISIMLDGAGATPEHDGCPHTGACVPSPTLNPKAASGRTRPPASGTRRSVSLRAPIAAEATSLARIL